MSALYGVARPVCRRAMPKRLLMHADFGVRVVFARISDPVRREVRAANWFSAGRFIAG